MKLKLGQTGSASINKVLSPLMSREDSLSSIVFVSSLMDLPIALEGVIHLEEGKTYFILDNIDLLGARIVCDGVVNIVGGSSETCFIRSTGLSGGQYLITSTHSLPIRNVSFVGNKLFNLEGDGTTAALDWLGVNFIDSNEVGVIKNYTNFVAFSCAFLNAGNLTFDGTIGSVVFDSTLFSFMANNPGLIIPATATITRRLRMVFSPFICIGTTTGLNVSTSASIPTEGYILDKCVFSGNGTYTAGVAYNDNKSLWTDNKGILNSGSFSGMFMVNNVTATVVSATNTEYKVLGTTTQSTFSQKFDHDNNRLTYRGAITRVFKVLVTATISSGNNHQVGMYIGKNGVVLPESETYTTTNASGRVENVVCQCLVSLATNDYIEIFVENTTAITNITINGFNLLAEPLQ